MVFIDLEQVYDKVLRQLIWWTLKEKDILIGYILDMCERVATS